MSSFDLNMLEKECCDMSANVDQVLKEITKAINKITAISVGNIQTASDVTSTLTSDVDTAIHSIYYLLSHCEELDKTMKPMYTLAAKIKKIKEILSALETNIY